MRLSAAIASACAASAFLGCADDRPLEPIHKAVSLAPTSQPSPEVLTLNRSDVQPMYREMLAVDLPSVVRLATAKNIDVLQARQRVEAERGIMQSSVGSLFPFIAPGVGFEFLQGSTRAVQGQLVPVNFTSWQPVLAVQWVLNPGRVYYNVLAARRRLEAAKHQEQSAELETVRAAANQYYDLVLAQARVASFRQAVAEAQEFMRLTELKVRSGTGTTADETRARAQLAAREQDLTAGLGAFYDASVALAVTLRMDATTTLAPAVTEVRQENLVRDDLSIEELLATAVGNRPDLRGVREFAAAAAAESRGAVWGAASPQVQGSYQVGGIESRAFGQTYGLRWQQRATAGANWALGVSTFGQVKTANAEQRIAALDADRALDNVRAEVIVAQQRSRTNDKLIPAAKRQVEAAQESLRLAELNLKAGTMSPLDVLVAENAVAEARLRYAEAVVRYNQSQVNLLAALGVLGREQFETGQSEVRPTEVPSTEPASRPSPEQQPERADGR